MRLKAKHLAPEAVIACARTLAHGLRQKVPLPELDCNARHAHEIDVVMEQNQPVIARKYSDRTMGNHVGKIDFD